MSSNLTMKAVVLSLRWLLSALLVAGAALFVIGVAAERNTEDAHHDEPTAARVEVGEGAKHDEAGEAAERTNSEAGAEHTEDQETLFGIDAESTPLVVAAVFVSVALAALVWYRRDRWLLWTVVAVAALFAAFDVAELVHQIDEHRIGIAVIAAVVAVTHAVATVVAETRATNESATG